MKPFVKWAGGKRLLVDRLEGYMPDVVRDYYEPMVGGGALFFHVATKQVPFRQAYLNDTNLWLLNCYEALKKDANAVIAELRDMFDDAQHGPKQFYYQVRKFYNDEIVGETDAFPPVVMAAMFIYLNKHGFNGLYRVNRKGEFNVPWGQRQTPEFDVEPLRAVGEVLERAALTSNDFERVVANAGDGDFVYFDPPYLNTFERYQHEGFNGDDHVRLADVAVGLKARGAEVLISNSLAAADLYTARGFEVEQVENWRSISRKAAQRGPAKEIVAF